MYWKEPILSTSSPDPFDIVDGMEAQTALRKSWGTPLLSREIDPWGRERPSFEENLNEPNTAHLPRPVSHVSSQRPEGIIGTSHLITFFVQH